jgi:uncharacterized protein (TIGR03437 family)
MMVLTSALSADAQTSSVTLNGRPSRQIGQPLLIPKTANPNLVEGREMWKPNGIALDTSTSPPLIYVADTLNNRVLAWKNATGFTNGQAADLIIGQPDQYTTTPSGPNTTFSTGLRFPSGLAVFKGDLYVADSGNNRILRYKAPFAQFAQTGSYPTPDLYVGQPSLKSNTANYPSGAPTAQGLNLFPSGSTLFPAGIAFDSSGDMWVVDPGNRRVLEFNASDVANGGGLLTAAVELGQLDFVSLQTQLNPGIPNDQLIANQFAVPSELAFDAAGNLYVSDADPNSPSQLSRVLVFAPKFTSGQSAARIMGVVELSQIQTLTAAQQLAIENETNMNGPAGIFFLADSSVGVVDSNNNRILIFPPYASWPAATTSVSPAATGVIGQNGSFQSFGVNGNTTLSVVTPPASAGVFSAPIAAVFLQSSNELFVVDTSNNRVLVMPSQSGNATVPFGNATQVLGQDTMTMNSPNLIEGREFQFFNGANANAGVALDTTGPVPHLYVADPYNHRVLGFYDARKLYATGVPEGQQASNEIVIGEPDFNTAICNYPSGDTTKTTASGLCYPSGVLTDSSGNLYVADTNNGRVVRFPAPFATWPKTQVLESADLVLGQTSLTGAPITDPSAIHMAEPYGLAFTGTNGLMVSDSFDNRVLYIPFSAGQTFNAPDDNGKTATKVFGQPDFVTITAGSAANQLSSPHHIAADTNGQVYVTDPGNGRVQIFADPNNPLTPAASADAILTLPNLTNPQSIFVNQSTGEIWVGTVASNVAVAARYPKYDTLQLNPASTGSVQVAGAALALAQDQYGDLFVSDAYSRVAVYYQGLGGENSQATYPGQPLAPGVIASLYASASQTQFATSSMPSGGVSLTAYPMPLTLADEQVMFNGAPAPLYFAGPSQINFVVPIGAPTTGFADVEVVQASTGQVLGASNLPMNAVSPAIFCGASGGCLLNGGFYQAAVLNQDNTVNSATNQAARGSVIQIFCTGQGALNNAPADGAPAGTSPLSTTPQTPRVAIGSCFVDDCPTLPGDPTNGKWVGYSGLAPGFAGLWQINVQIPMATVPGAQVPIAIQYDGVGSANLSSGFHLTIAVK